MKISIVIPAYNEAETILEIISRVEAICIDKEIVVVDDHSTDGTRDILKEAERRYSDVQMLYHDHNRGKGAA